MVVLFSAFQFFCNLGGSLIQSDLHEKFGLSASTDFSPSRLGGFEPATFQLLGPGIEYLLGQRHWFPLALCWTVLCVFSFPSSVIPTILGDVISIGKQFKKVAQPRTRLRGNPTLKVIMVARAKCEADFHLFTLRYFVTLNSVRPITSPMHVLPYGTARCCAWTPFTQFTLSVHSVSLSRTAGVL